MTEYLEPIRTALRIFPAPASGLLVPLMVLHYRRYGRVEPKRAFVLYSLLFYCMTALFLVILPLPQHTSDFCSRYAGTRTPQLVPFAFAPRLAELAVSRGVTSVGDVVALMGSREFLQVFFNFLLLFPLGVYLRYYFRVSPRVGATVLFATTLGFELLQLTGLCGLYPCPYRLFDVDDLMLNTAGGLIGYLAASTVAPILPSLEPAPLGDPAGVSLPRRALAFAIDLGVAVLLVAVATLLGAGRAVSWYWLAGGASGFVLVLVPWLRRGQTTGQSLVRIAVRRLDGRQASPGRLFLRFAALVLFPAGLSEILFSSAPLHRAFGLAGGVAEVLLTFGFAVAWLAVVVFRRDHRGPHELLSRTKLLALPPAAGPIPSTGDRSAAVPQRHRQRPAA